MEDGLVQPSGALTPRIGEVLILIVVEDGLVPSKLGEYDYQSNGS